MFSFFKKKQVSFNNQLQTLKSFGIALKSEIVPNDLLEEFSKQAFLEDPYQLLLITMGGELFRDDEFYIVSNNIWHLDTECIEDSGDYVRIIERLMKLSNIEIQNIKDYVDIEIEEAWISFEFGSKIVKWELKVDGNWIDPEIFDKFIQLIGNRSNRNIVIATLGQDCLVAYLSEEQLLNINRLVKYKFK
jgi:hypothetical protein